MDLTEGVDPVRVEPFVVVCLDLSVDTGVFVALLDCFAAAVCALDISDWREGEDTERWDACLGALVLFGWGARFANEPCTGERSVGDGGGLESPPFGNKGLEGTASDVDRVTKVSTSLEDMTFSRLR